MVKISSIIPKEIMTELPIAIEVEGEIIFDKIVIYAPTLERMESFQNDIDGVTEDGEILISLIKNFTDVDMEDLTVESLGNFQK